MKMLLNKIHSLEIEWGENIAVGDAYLKTR